MMGLWVCVACSGSEEQSVTLITKGLWVCVACSGSEEQSVTLITKSLWVCVACSGFEEQSVLQELVVKIRRNQACAARWGWKRILNSHVCVGNGDGGACNVSVMLTPAPSPTPPPLNLNMLLLQFQIQIQNTLLSVAIITIKRKLFFAHTSSATLNSVVKLI